MCRYAVTPPRGRERLWAVIARETGLDVRKLQRWNTRARRAASVPVLRPVEVLPSPSRWWPPDADRTERRAHRGAGARAGRAAPPPARVIGLSRRVRVFAYTRPVDMRKQYDGLYALVVAELKADPLSGDLFLFTNRRRTRAKVLCGTARVCASTRSDSSADASLRCGCATNKKCAN